MTSLSEFKVWFWIFGNVKIGNLKDDLVFFQVSSSSRTNMNGDASYARPVRSQRLMDNSAGDGSRLDSMLGSLQSDLSKHGITTIPKGDCAACNKSIVGQVWLGSQY